MHYWGVASLTQVAVTDSYLQGFPSANWRPGMEPVDHEINTVINKKKPAVQLIILTNCPRSLSTRFCKILELYQTRC